MNYVAGFPKQMMHPQFQPGMVQAVPRGTYTDVHGVTHQMSDMVGTSTRFPPMLAETPDQEAEARSRGYLAAGEAPKVTDYSEYPMMLRHPEHRDGVQATTEMHQVNGVWTPFPVPAIPELYPDKLVRNPEEEREWTEKGWARPGKADDRAFERARSAPGMPGTEWPKWVDGVLMQDPDTPAPGPQKYPMWVRLSSGQEVIANTRAEHEKLCGPLSDNPEPVKADPKPSISDADWAEFQEFKAWKAARDAVIPHELAKQAVTNIAAAAELQPRFDAAEQAPKAADIEALRDQATGLGIEVDGRWGQSRLEREIARKMGL